MIVNCHAPNGDSDGWLASRWCDDCDASESDHQKTFSPSHLRALHTAQCSSKDLSKGSFDSSLSNSSLRNNSRHLQKESKLRLVNSTNQDVRVSLIFSLDRIRKGTEWGWGAVRGWKEETGGTALSSVTKQTASPWASQQTWTCASSLRFSPSHMGWHHGTSYLHKAPTWWSSFWIGGFTYILHRVYVVCVYWETHSMMMKMAVLMFVCVGKP